MWLGLYVFLLDWIVVFITWKRSIDLGGGSRLWLWVGMMLGCMFILIHWRYSCGCLFVCHLVEGFGVSSVGSCVVELCLLEGTGPSEPGREYSVLWPQDLFLYIPASKENAFLKAVTQSFLQSSMRMTSLLGLCWWSLLMCPVVCLCTTWLVPIIFPW